MAEADEARARGDSDVREAKRAKTEPAASDPDAQKALETQKKRVAQLEDQLGTATEEKLFAKSAADAARHGLRRLGAGDPARHLVLRHILINHHEGRGGLRNRL